MQHDHVLKKLIFNILIPSLESGGGGMQAKYLLPYCFVPYSLKFEMQHDHVLKTLKFDLLTLSPGSGGVGGGLRVKYLLPCCCICNFIYFENLHHGHVM